MIMAVAIAADTTKGPGRDRFYIIAASFMLLVTLAGFAPTFFLAPLFGADDLPRYLIVHGTFAASWVALFLIQTALVHASNVRLHRKIGPVAAAVAAGMVASGLYVLYAVVQGSENIAADMPRISSMVWGNLTILASFSAFVALGFRYRRRRETHKRLMFLATFSMMGQPLVRVGWIELFRLSETRAINDAIFGLGGLAILLLSVLVYETWTRGRPHAVTAGGGTLFLASVIVAGLFLPATATGTGLITWMARH